MTTTHTPLPAPPTSSADTAPVAHALQAAERSVVHMTEQVADLSRQGVHAVQDTAQQFRQRMQHANDCTAAYVRTQPLKAVLMAAALGAMAVMVLNWVGRRGDKHP